MVLPFLLGAAAISAGAVGVKNGVDAASKDAKANKICKKTAQKYESAKKRLDKARNKTTASLEDLGELKLEVWSQQLGRFVKLFGQLKKVDFSERDTFAKCEIRSFTEGEIAQMKNLSIKASEALTGGIGALGAGALAGIASYGGATMFASASTGTAISTLSGAAATNATLAWFGGGSLAAGGLGMAGGMAVLGGIVAGPALAVGGLMMSAEAKKKLAKAKKYQAIAEKEIQQMETAISVLVAIETVAQKFAEVIQRLAESLSPLLDNLEAIIATNGNNYADYTADTKRFVYLTVQYAQVLKLVLETSLLTKEGALNENCYKALQAGREVLEA